MLVDKLKALDVRMTDYVKRFLRDSNPGAELVQEEEKLAQLRPNIPVESDGSEDGGGAEADSEDELQIEFEEEESEGGSGGEGNEGFAGNGKMDFGNKFREPSEATEKEVKIDV